MSAIPKLFPQVVIQTGSSGFVDSGAYQSPTTRSIAVEFRDEAGNVVGHSGPIVTRFFVDEPRSCQLEWNNRVEDMYDGVYQSGEGNTNSFTTIHESEEDVVVRIGCLILDEHGFWLKANPAIVTVLGPYEGE